MLNAIRTALIVIAITTVVWLFAEAESLSERSEITRIRLIVPQGQESRVTLDYQQAFSGQVTVELRGTRASLDAARRILNNGIELTPDQAGVANTDGPQQLSLLQVLGNYPDLIEQRVEVLSVRPPTLTVVRTELMEIQLPVKLESGSLSLEGPPTIDPRTVTVRLPARTPAELYEDQTVAAFFPINFDPTQAEPGRTILFEDLELSLPPTLLPRPDTTIVGDPSVSAEFTIQTTTTVQAIDDVYTWVVLPWDQADQWVVTVAPEHQVRSVSFSGPQEVLRTLTRDRAAIVAVVTLSFDQLAQGQATVSPKLFRRTDEGLEPLPPGVIPVRQIPPVAITSTSVQPDAAP